MQTADCLCLKKLSKNFKLVYQEEKHCLVLITHLGLTRDPPQKWFPFLHVEGHWSNVAQQQQRIFDLMGSSNTISFKTHLSLRLTVHGEFPGIPLTIRNLVLWKRSSLFPHSLNSTFSALRKKMEYYGQKYMKKLVVSF